jgi:hypothetical protein
MAWCLWHNEPQLKRIRKHGLLFELELRVELFVNQTSLRIVKYVSDIAIRIRIGIRLIWSVVPDPKLLE